jgi:hypothetical protein
LKAESTPGLEGLGKLKKEIIDLIGTGTCDLPAYSLMPRPYTFSLAPYVVAIFM